MRVDQVRSLKRPGLSRKLCFPFEKYGYKLERVLNNENRWRAKIVCAVLDKRNSRYVSTTYAKRKDYLALLETTAYLKCRGRLSPEIVQVYPENKTIVCEHIGEFLSDYILTHPDKLYLSLNSIRDYFKAVNLLNQAKTTFIIPAIVKNVLELSTELSVDFELLPRSKPVLLWLQRSGIQFVYGCGIEDPHIWNFRLISSPGGIQGLTTDFDFFSNRVNCLWQFGYFCATFRWLKQACFSLNLRSKNAVSFWLEKQDLKSRFMFWLGALSSYCGYQDSLRILMLNGGMAKLKEQYQLIKQIDEKVALLGEKLLNGYPRN